tara:strand:+ start:955 stop:2856 length:1902 start_codon:yes stop_codon:yes gene_type:complete
MATYNITLLNQSTYTVVNASNRPDLVIGDQLVFNVTHPGTVTSNHTIVELFSTSTDQITDQGTNPQSLTNSVATFTYTVPSGISNGIKTFHFYGASGSPYWNNSTGHLAAFQINVVSAVCSTIPSGTLSVSLGSSSNQFLPATLSGVSSASGCNLQFYFALEAEYQQGTFSNFTNGGNVLRGQFYRFKAQHQDVAGGPETGSTFIPYIAPDLTIGLANNITSFNTSDGTFTVNMVNISGATTYQLRNSASNVVNQLNGVQVSGATQLVSNDPSRVPAGSTQSFQIWGVLATADGGSGVFAQTNTSFSVTRAATHNESIVNPSGVYFDNDTDSGAIHYVKLANTTSGFLYGVKNSGGTLIATYLSGATDRNPTDTAASVPSGTNTTQSTYSLFRRSSAGVEADTGVTYTRTIANYDRFTFLDSTKFLEGTDTEFTQSISNTISGHTYYIYNGTNIVAQGTGNGGALTLTVTETGIPNINDTATHTLKTLSPVNADFTQEYATGATYTVTRTGTSTETPSGTTSAFGLQIFAANGSDLLYDTTSRTGRVMASGRVPTSGTIASGGNQDVTVTGVANSSDFQVVLVPLTQGTGTTGVGAAEGHKYTLTKSSNKFNVKNDGSGTNAYNYFVIKSGGS